MSFLDYIKEKSIVLFVNFILLIVLVGFLIAGRINKILIIYVVVFWILSVVSIFISDFYKKNSYYKKIINNFNNIDRKYLINEIVPEPDFIEGKIYYDMLYECNRCMHEEINKYKYEEENYREYIESWIHEIKIPIASSKLIIENNKNDVTLNILEEIEKIEGFSEQVLYYARSANVEKDYIIKEIQLNKLINNVIKKNSKYFIQNKIKLQLNNLNEVVYSDSKWIEFILVQIINNSIKYRDSIDPCISIYSMVNENNIELHIKDNGIGICSKDLKNVFNKGFTGENGRKFNKSTGMGLYLSKKLCLKLGIYIYIDSNIDEGTEIVIIFLKDKECDILRN